MPRTILHFKETLDVVQSYHHYVSIRFLFKKGENEDLFLLKADISMLSIEFTFIHYFYSNITFGARRCKMREFYIDILYWTFFEVTNDSNRNHQKWTKLQIYHILINLLKMIMKFSQHHTRMITKWCVQKESPRNFIVFKQISGFLVHFSTSFLQIWLFCINWSPQTTGNEVVLPQHLYWQLQCKT